ncbi:Clp protease N-terminal domain-containing protein [Kitasatospora sp. NPDC059577]|uniref:Clp protease N-terminal domain-containing protein n=1 Tax=Kitasatospora sp. NPDC059577 TaxID=3346873 RepID=UPI0036AE8DA9
METTLEADWRTLDVTGDGRLGTEHLLAAVAGASGPAGAALTAAGVAEGDLRALLRERARGHGAGWGADDGAESGVPAREVLGSTGAPDLVLTGAAARVLSAAVAQVRRDGGRKLTAEHVLRALLADDRTRAAELLRAAGVVPSAVRERLDGVADGLDPLLLPTRDALLGRRSHRLPRWRRMVRSGAAGPAASSADWIRRETDDQARRLGRRTPGTEHVLLAVLAVHEVLGHEPQPDVDDTGGELLAWLGFDYARVRAAVTAGTVALPADPRSVETYLAGAAPGPLVRVLLDEDTRARRLAEALRAGGVGADVVGAAVAGADGRTAGGRTGGGVTRPAGWQDGWQDGPGRWPEGQRVV